MNTMNEKLHKINCLLSETSGLYHRMNVHLGLSDSVSNILYVIYDHDGVYPISDICTDTGIPKQTINSALRGMERNGLLFLENCGKRAKQAVLTVSGKEYCRQTVARIFEMEKEVLSGFTPEEYTQFVRLHEKYNNAIRAYIEGLPE